MKKDAQTIFVKDVLSPLIQKCKEEYSAPEEIKQLVDNEDSLLNEFARLANDYCKIENTPFPQEAKAFAMKIYQSSK